MATFIHPTAVIEPGAQIGDGCEIMAGAVIKSCAVLGGRVSVCECAVIGGAPQSVGFDRATKSGVRIGAGTTIREYVTVNRATKPDGFTSVGENCLLMACAHVAHDCQLADNVILANAVLLGGHITVGAHAFIGGSAVVHQFARVGESVMISGNAGISRDLAPFVLAAERDFVIGLNLVGMKRRGLARESIREIKDAFREVYHTRANIREVAASALANGRYATPEAKRFLEFFSGGKRGFSRRAGRSTPVGGLARVGGFSE
jgi:UDP-N-acetylglucosamine acyltransferase